MPRFLLVLWELVVSIGRNQCPAKYRHHTSTQRNRPHAAGCPFGSLPQQGWHGWGRRLVTHSRLSTWLLAAKPLCKVGPEGGLATVPASLHLVLPPPLTPATAFSFRSRWAAMSRREMLQRVMRQRRILGTWALDSSQALCRIPGQTAGVARRAASVPPRKPQLRPRAMPSSLTISPCKAVVLPLERPSRLLLRCR